MNDQFPPPSLSNLGYTPTLAAELAELGAAATPGRILRIDGHRALVLSQEGEQEATLPGRLRADPESAPTVGDWVALSPVAATDRPVILARLSRRTRLARGASGTATRIQVIAANVDRVFIVMGLDGDFNPRRAERYLTICGDAGVEAVLLLTKAGGCDDVGGRLAACRAIAPPELVLGVHAIDVIDGINPDVPADYTGPGITVALLGSSGAGKSTLLNHLLGRERMATAAVRSGDDRGRHTTTHRELVLLPSGGVLIDNPGMRELSLWLVGEGLERAFTDVESVARGCRFSDCSHNGEPGCAVQRAIDEGELDGDRATSYTRLRDEAEANARRRDERSRRADERSQSKLYRRFQKERRRRKG